MHHIGETAFSERAPYPFLTASSGRTQPGSSESNEQRDLLASDPGWQWEWETIREDVGLVIENFDTKMDDPLANRQKLHIIEKLLARNRRVVVTSCVSPLRFTVNAPSIGSSAASALPGKGSGKSGIPAEGGGGDRGSSCSEAGANGGDYAVRWVRAFDSFEQLYKTGCIEDSNGDGREIEEGNPGASEDKTRFYSVLKASGHVWDYLERIQQQRGNGSGSSLA